MWVGAALTKPGRASTARWCGSGERDGKEYERNQRFTSLKVSTGLPNLADRAGCGAHPHRWLYWLVGELLGGSRAVRREAMVKVYGVTMAMPQGQSWAPHPSSEQQ